MTLERPHMYFRLPQLICFKDGKKHGGCVVITYDLKNICEHKDDCLYQLKHGPGIHPPRRKKEGK